MQTPFTLAEAVLIAALCLFAIGSARAADPTPQERDKEYQITMNRADAHYRGTLRACEDMEGIERDVCFRKAKATFIRATADAKARLPTQSAVEAPAGGAGVSEKQGKM